MRRGRYVSALPMSVASTQPPTSGALLPLIAEKWRAHGGAWNAQQQIGTKMPMLRGVQRVARGRLVSAALITGGGHEPVQKIQGL
jgi:hypothetical protein